MRLCAENGGDPARPGKKDPVDPLVWLGERPGEPAWPSALGPGRPGWHVECAAIATHYLGRTFDVQAGGRDLIFPHHEMSAAHARVALDGGGERPFARRYAHSAMVRLDGEKMSKSRGNLVFVSELLAAGKDPMAIRLAVISHNYRADWDWTANTLDSAAAKLADWRAAVATSSPGGPASSRSAAASDGAGQHVLAAMRERIADDLDAPGAIAVVDEWAAATAAGRTDGSGALVRGAVDALLGIAL
jgi:L-cysteine:1D-myo-inositol 2-amino-2-deoxy-alpha-D-glucopyranoside ligase